MTGTDETKADWIRLSVRHRTVFEYGAAVINSVNTLHLEPRSSISQKTSGCVIKVLPATRLERFEDLFGNVAHHFEIESPHRRLEVESILKVRNRRFLISEEAMNESLPVIGRTELYGTTWQYLQDSRWVSATSAIWKQAVDLTAGLGSVYSMANRIMGWIHTEFLYVAGVTDANSHMDDVLSLKKGVCQDFTHVMIGLCRSIGIPARYVSGYLYNGPRDTLVGAQASHAWCEVFLPADGWTGFDPTNNNLADERYVKIAVGRDYEDVAPVRGAYRGSGHCRMDIQVVVERT